MKRKSRGITVINICIGLFFLFCVIFPIFSMFRRITPEGFRTMVRLPMFGQAVRNSLTTSLATTCITLCLAFFAAWSTRRIVTKFQTCFDLIFTVPMLIPSISHAFGLVALFGTDGILTNLFGIHTGIYGFIGIIAGGVLYSFPVAYLMFADILRYEDGMPHKAAEVLGVPLWHRFKDITLPYMRKTIISAFFTIFTMVITDYGVPLMIGGKVITLPVLMYNKAVGMIDYDSGSVIGMFLLLPAVIAFIVDLINPERIQSNYVTEGVSSNGSKVQKTVAYIFCGLICMLILMPVTVFFVMMLETKYPVNSTPTLSHIQAAVSRGALGYLLHSVLYSVFTSLIGTALAFLCAYMTARAKGPLHRCVHLMSLVSMAIPGIVLGLSYVIFFHGTMIYGTILIILLVNTIHFFSSPYLMIYNTLGKVNQNLEDVGLTLGISRRAIIMDVILPKVKWTLLEMFSYFFVNSMMTISAVAFLAPPSPKPVALMINQFEAQLLIENAAFVSLLILVVNLTMRGIVYLLKSKNFRRRCTENCNIA